MQQAPVLAWWWVLLLVLGPGAVPRAVAAQILQADVGAGAERGIYVLDAKVLVDARPVALRHIITHLCDHREQMENLSYCRVFEAAGRNSWSYAVVDLPVLNPRDYVIKSTVTQELAADGTGVYKSCWEVAPDKGPPPRKGFVRLAVNQGCWVLSPAENGKKTFLTYQVRLNPGGVVPGWAAGYVARRTLPEYMNLLERLSRAQEAAGVPPPDPEQPWSGLVIRPLDNPLPPARGPLPPLPPAP
jgi:hypothetical protein